MFNLFDSCEHLELKPLENEKDDVKAYLYEFKKENTTPEEKKEYMNFLINRAYESYCKARDCPCIVSVSPVASQGSYGIGNFHQPLGLTLVHLRNIRKCEDRKTPEKSINGTEPLDVLLLKHIRDK